MEHLRDLGHLDITHYLQTQSSELHTLQTELARLSSAYHDIETKLPPAPGGPPPPPEELQTEQRLVAYSPVSVGSVRVREKRLTMLSEDLEGEG